MDERDQQLAIIKVYCKGRGRSCRGCPLFPFECSNMPEWSNYEVYKAYQILFGQAREAVGKLLEASKYERICQIDVASVYPLPLIEGRA